MAMNCFSLQSSFGDEKILVSTDSVVLKIDLGLGTTLSLFEGLNLVSESNGF